MLTIAINSATLQTEVALVNEKKMLAEKSWTGKKNEAEKILPALSSILKKTKNKWSNVQSVLVIAGPGPFTGLRVGVTIANAVGWSTGGRMKTAGVFQYLRQSLPQKLRSKTVLITKGGGEYLALFFHDDKKEKLVKAGDVAKILKKSAAKFAYAEMKESEVTSLKKLLVSEKIPMRLIGRKELRSFGDVAVELLKQSGKTSIAKPLYFQKPHITLSKQEVFTQKKTHNS